MPTKLWEGLKLHIMRVNALISDKGVCRTAPATPGPLNMRHYDYVFAFQAKCYLQQKKMPGGPFF